MKSILEELKNVNLKITYKPSGKEMNEHIPFSPKCKLMYGLLLLHLRSMRAKLLQSCPTLCNPIDCSPPGSSVHGILQARILERVTISSSRGSSRPEDLPDPGIKPMSPALAGGFFTTEPLGKSTQAFLKFCGLGSVSPAGV